MRAIAITSMSSHGKIQYIWWEEDGKLKVRTNVKFLPGQGNLEDQYEDLKDVFYGNSRMGTFATYIDIDEDEIDELLDQDLPTDIISDYDPGMRPENYME